MKLLLLGPAGSGKGTQAVRIAGEYGIPHVSTGDMFRVAMATGTELGRRVQPLYDAGELIPDDLTISLIEERLSEDDAIAGFVLDGFPRNLAQAEALDALLRESRVELDAVVDYRMAIERIVARLSGRVLVS